MKKIGITGGVGSGKSRVLEYLNQKPQVFTCQADQIAFELQQPGEACYEEMLQYFGKEMLLPDGRINRKKLGNVVFQDAKKLQVLNSIVHPHVNQKIEELISEQEKKGTLLFILEAALLNNPYYRTILDEIWYIYAQEKVRRERLRESRNYTDQKIDDMMKAQATEDEFRNLCDKVIDNTGEFKETQQQLEQLLNN